MTLPAGDRGIPEDVVRYAQANNVTQIVIGKSARSRWFEMVHGSVVHDLVRRSGNISVHVIAGDAVAGEPVPKKAVRAAERDDTFNPRPYIAALVAVAFATGFGELIGNWIGVGNVDLIFLTAIVAVAVRLGLLPSLLASLASAARLQFFLPAADLHLHHHRSEQRRRLRAFHAGRHHRVERRGARTHTGEGGDRTRPRHRISLFIQPQACRRRNARRRPLGHRLSDRLAAESAGHAAAARARFDRGQGRLSAGRHP